jgi:S1-C subfamily serine protease
VWSIGLRFAPSSVVVAPAALVAGGSAAGAGIRDGDTLVSINGRPAAEFAWPEVLGALIQEGKPMNFVVRRGGRDEPVIVMPVLVVR